MNKYKNRYQQLESQSSQTQMPPVWKHNQQQPGQCVSTGANNPTTAGSKYSHIAESQEKMISI